MKNKTIRMLLSILHICIACIGVLLLSRRVGTDVQDTSSIQADADITIMTGPAETAEIPETALGIGIEMETEEAAAETAQETEAEQTTETMSSATAEDMTEAMAEATAEAMAEAMAEAGTGTASAAVATFRYTGRERNLNIRKGPSTNEPVIGKIPRGKGGTVLEMTGNGWALIEYNGITGYCSLKCMILD